MKKAELRENAANNQYVWWLKRLDTPMGGARQHTRIPVLLLSGLHKGKTGKTARYIDMRVVGQSAVETIDFQMLAVMTAEEEATARASDIVELVPAAKRSDGRAPTVAQRLAKLPSISRQGICRNLAERNEVPIWEAELWYERLKVEIMQAVFDGYRVSLPKFITIGPVIEPSTIIRHVKTRKIQHIKPAVRLRVYPALAFKAQVSGSDRLAKRIQESYAANP